MNQVEYIAKLNNIESNIIKMSKTIADQGQIIIALRESVKLYETLCEQKDKRIKIMQDIIDIYKNVFGKV